MTSRKRKSKKHSGTKTSFSEQLNDITFFVDRSSGKYELVDGLRALGLNVERHDDHFDSETLDPVWIAACGEKNWVIVSSDKAIKRNELEKAAILNAGVAALFFTSANITSAQQIEAFHKAGRRIANLITTTRRPFIARISQDGSVELWLNHKGVDLIRSKSTKRKSQG
jgi:hypothetical protein